MYIKIISTLHPGSRKEAFNLPDFEVKWQNQSSVLEIGSLGSIRLVTMNLSSSLFNNAHLTAAMAVFRAKR